MTKHTPGPWTTHYDEPQSFSGWSDAGGYRIDADGIEQLAYVWSRSNRLMGNGAPQSAGPEFGAKDAEANARLIAAAPEMLAALDELLALHDNAANNGPRPTTEQVEDWYKRVEKQARAAIAKAKGE